MAGVVSGVEVAERGFDEVIGAELPFFVAGDADFFAGAAGPGVGATERPVILDTFAVLSEVVEENLQIRKSGHEVSCSIGDRRATDAGSSVINCERAAWSEERRYGFRILAAPGGGVAGGKIPKLRQRERH